MKLYTVLNQLELVVSSGKVCQGPHASMLAKPLDTPMPKVLTATLALRSPLDLLVSRTQWEQ